MSSDININDNNNMDVSENNVKTIKNDKNSLNDDEGQVSTITTTRLAGNDNLENSSSPSFQENKIIVSKDRHYQEERYILLQNLSHYLGDVIDQMAAVNRNLKSIAEQSKHVERVAQVWKEEFQK